VNPAESLFDDEERVIAWGEALLDQQTATLPAKDFLALLSRYKKLHRQTVRLVRMGDRMQGQLNRLNDELTQSEAKYRRIFESGIQGNYRATPIGRLLDANPAMADIFDYPSPDEMLRQVKDMATDIFLSPAQHRTYLRALQEQGILKDYPLKLRRRDGSMVWVELCSRGIFSDAGKLLEIEGLMADVTEKRDMIKQLKAMARQDCLTGLWNRRYFIELGQREVDRAKRENSPLSLVFFDLDHFKRINDNHGHEAGDQVLADLSGLCRRHLRAIDVFGRVGGEEFAVLLPGTTTSGAVSVAEKLRTAIAANAVRLPQATIRCTASFGVASTQAPVTNLDRLLKEADSAMYRSKEGGRNHVSTVTNCDQRI
jgi:diguanylate cyclase (GGDEF)-like protein/PAS domain S-box-containing protein